MSDATGKSDVAGVGDVTSVRGVMGDASGVRGVMGVRDARGVRDAAGMSMRHATALLLELRAAVTAGMAPGAALVEAVRRHPGAMPGLAPVAGRLAVGASLPDALDAVPPGDALAALLVRALAVAEYCGAGAVEGLAQAESALRDEAALRRRLRVRAARAKGTLRVLALVPAAAVALLVVVQPAALRFYTLRLGQVTAALAVLLTLLARHWAKAIMRAVPRAAGAADPLGVAEGGGAAEVAELLGMALAAGLPTGTAIGLVARLGPPVARPWLERAARAAVAGGGPVDGLRGTPLTELGAVLDAAARWGSPAHDGLRAYAAAIRADRATALDEAAERAELRLVFPTTLLTLPSFLLAVVPPLLWTAFQR